MNNILHQRLPHTQVPALAMPIGGIGTGGFAVNADGSLRQWQLRGQANHRAAMPGTGFWVRVSQVEPPMDVVSLLQGLPVPDPRAPLVTDGEIPAWMREAAERIGTFSSATFSGTYPVAEVELEDERHPLAVTMRVLNPMVPGDVTVSSIPTGMFEFTIRNTGTAELHGTLAGSLLNMVGWDGVVPITAHTSGLGGNTNRLVRGRGWTRIVMENPTLTETDELAGQLILAADDESAASMPRCAGVEELVAFLGTRGVRTASSRIAFAPQVADPLPNAPAGGKGPSGPGRTWLGVIGVPFTLAPGEQRTIRFSMSWHFPNRFVDSEQFGDPQAEWGPTRFYLGNGSALRYLDALDVQRVVEGEWATLTARTLAWTSTLVGSDLDRRTVDRMAAQAAYVRSPSCFVGADGRFYGFEGSLGASTRMWTGDIGGSCPLNCTHVWLYEAAMAALWPELERNMRDTEFDIMQAPDGKIPHRLRVPVYLRQMWDESIGGPETPALDGMLGTILKTLRDVQHGAGPEWLQRRWPQVRMLFHHITRTWDADRDGVLHGIQPSTHDIDLAGVNSFMGSLWLTALRAVEELARYVGDDQIALDAEARFSSGRRAYDDELFNGEQYIQVLDDGDPTNYQWLAGVLSDQLIGQWWAHQLGLGYVLPADHVRRALEHVVSSNLRSGFADFENSYRIYADAMDDVGLLMCTWPDGGRPDVPTRYCDEVWSGVEYQVAAHCLYEGLDDAAQAVLDGLWTRHDGRRRNPYNEIECGDHYVRAMAGWTVLQARSGVHVDELSGVLTVSRTGRWPWLSSTGFGTIVVGPDSASVECVEGTFDLELQRR